MAHKRDTNQRLSAAGARRRERMRSELLAAMHLHHARRSERRRAGIAACVCILLLIGALLAWQLPQSAQHPYAQSSPPPHQPAIAPADAAEEPGTAAPPSSPQRFVGIQTDPDILERYRTRDSLRLVQFIGDEQLLLLLAEMNRPAGLVRTDNKVWLTRPVADTAPPSDL